jgi:hydrogenase nickel incorporation protein HypA/HybF
MHELGLVLEIVRIAERRAREEKAAKVTRIVLQIGELSALVPELLEACYPAAVYGTLLADAELSIETLPANAICRNCKKVFNVIDSKFKCPVCEAGKWELLSGREVIIKEIQII